MGRQGAPPPQLPLVLETLPALEGLLVPAIPRVLGAPMVPPLPCRQLLQPIAEVPAPRETLRAANAA